MSAAPLLFASLAPTGGYVVRRWSCGCVTRGRWRDTPEPALRWWIPAGVVYPCADRVTGKSCAAVRGEDVA